MSNTIFSGNSRFASDFSTIIDRAVGIASLPISILNNQKNALSNKADALTEIGTKFASIRTTLTSLQDAVSNSTLTTATSDSTIAKAKTTSSALPGIYDVSVVSSGAASVSFSKDSLTKVTDPYSSSVSTATTFDLSVDGTTVSITPATNSLADLATSINNANAGVKANIINIGTSTTPDYRLSLRSDKLGDIPISLNDGSQELLDQLSAGTTAQYRVNGLPPTAIESDSATVSIAPGIRVDLLKAGSTTLTISQSSDSIENALKSFITAFNASVDQLDLHRGKNGGALTADNVIATLSDDLRGIGGYDTGGSGIASLGDLGISFDRNGHLALDSDTFAEAASGSFSGVLSFLGSASSGFLKSAEDTLSTVDDSTSGLVTKAQTQYKDQIKRQNDLIAANQDRVALLKASLTERIAASDALIAGLEQQVTLFEGLFASTSNKN